jgi:hypothetical protein
MDEMFERKGKTIEEAFAAMLGDLKKAGALYAVQVADGDYVVGIKAVKPCITEIHEWENDRKVFYRKQIEDCSDLVWANIKKGRHFYCFRDLPEQGFYAGNTYYCGNDSVITNKFGCGEVFNPIDVPFHFRLATQDEIEQYYIERRKNLNYGEELRRRILESEDDDND